MPPLIVWGVGVLGGAALVRWAIKEAQRINRELEDARLARMAETMQTRADPKAPPRSGDGRLPAGIDFRHSGAREARTRNPSTHARRT